MKGLTTAYEYLEKRFDLKSRLLGSTLFVLTVILRAGTLLYGAALLFSAVVPTDLVPGLTSVEEAVILFGAIAIFYTVMGGISAVIWTDVIQFGVMSLGVFASIWVAATGAAEGFFGAFEIAGEMGKLDILHVADDGGNAFGGKALLTAVFGYGLLALSLFGTNQQPVQRYMTVSSPREAQRALILGVSVPERSACCSPSCWAPRCSCFTARTRPCCPADSRPTRSCRTSSTRRCRPS